MIFKIENQINIFGYNQVHQQKATTNNWVEKLNPKLNTQMCTRLCKVGYFGQKYLILLIFRENVQFG